jgi:mannose-6-phosphate isomerase
LSPLDRRLLPLEPQPHERLWGGQHLHAASPPIGEEWIAHGLSRVGSGPFAGLTIDALAARYDHELLGTTVSSRFGTRFPLLIKLLDCADWLSVQVHPDDEQARRIVGPGEFGKTEAWYFISAEPGAQIIAGVKPGVSRDELAGAIREGRVLEVANLLDVHDGETLLVPAGTLHALGPGLLLYEVQQASDTTYRVYDWNRPSSTGRKLHIEESVEVVRSVGPAELRNPQVSGDTGTATAIRCSYFKLNLVRVAPGGNPLIADTAGRSFHLLTVVEGTAEIRHKDERLVLRRFETALVAGSTGEYEICGNGGPGVLLSAAVPD